MRTILEGMDIYTNLNTGLRILNVSSDYISSLNGWLYSLLKTNITFFMPIKCSLD